MASAREREIRAQARSVYFDTLRSMGPDEHLLLLAKEVEEERNRRAERAVPNPRTKVTRTR